MENLEKKPGKKFNIYFFAILFLVLFLALVLVYIRDRQVSNPLPIGFSGNSETSGISDMIKDNQQALQEARGIKYSLVPSINKEDNYLGEIGSPVEVVYYADASAPFAEMVWPVIEQLSGHYTGDIVIAYRHFVDQEDATGMLAASALECAARQGRFWELLPLLIDLNEERNMSEDAVLSAALSLGFEEEPFKECLSDKAVRSAVAGQSEDAEKYGVNGVPTIFVNKIILPGAYPFEDFTDSAGYEREGLKSIIDKELFK